MQFVTEINDSPQELLKVEKKDNYKNNNYIKKEKQRTISSYLKKKKAKVSNNGISHVDQAIPHVCIHIDFYT